MAHRRLYLAAYDISCPQRLSQGLRVLKGYACGGQKSVFECFLTAAERRALLAEMEEVIEPRDDRFLLLPLAGDRTVRTLGIALQPEDPAYYYVG
ncbi:MAG: CRISPR-associated endonuclease Cas2 [Gammaproteobacteria bacterium]